MEGHSLKRLHGMD